MNIKRAKQEIKHTIQAYLSKNSHGEYEIPFMRQRPVVLMGPPGIGKTAIRLMHYLYASILLCPFVTHFRAIIGAAVVNKYYLNIFKRLIF